MSIKVENSLSAGSLANKLATYEAEASKPWTSSLASSESSFTSNPVYGTINNMFQLLNQNSDHKIDHRYKIGMCTIKGMNEKYRK